MMGAHAAVAAVQAANRHPRSKPVAKRKHGAWEEVGRRGSAPLPSTLVSAPTRRLRRRRFAAELGFKGLATMPASQRRASAPGAPRPAPPPHGRLKTEGSAQERGATRAAMERPSMLRSEQGTVVYSALTLSVRLGLAAERAKAQQREGRRSTESARWPCGPSVFDRAGLVCLIGYEA